MIVQLGDVIQKILGNEDRLTTEREFYVGGEHFISGNLEVKQRGIIKNEDLGYQFHFPFECGDVLFMTKNPRLRKAGRADFSGICSIATFVIRTKSELVLSQDFLPVIFQSDDFWDYLIANQSGSVNPFIKWGTLEKYTFNLPDISVQNHYCKIIWDLQELINTLEKHSSLLDQLVKSRFIEMFGDPYLSPKYSKRPFLDCLDFNPGKTEVRDLPDETMVSFVPMESVGTDGSIDVSKKKTLGEVRKGYTYFRDNDVVFAKITPCFENGKVAIASGCQNGIGFGTTEFHVARPIDGVSNSTWLLTLLRSNSLRHLASGNMSGTAGQKRVQQPFFEKLSIGLPPIEEQEKFAKFYNQVDKSRFV